MSEVIFIKKTVSINIGKIFVFGILILLLSGSAASAATEKILVATNRYVILDDPISTGKTAQTAANFALPWSGSSNWNRNDWTTAQTTIKGYALVLSEDGTPIKNTPVVFTIRNWNSAYITTSTPINTDPNGMASYSLDLNAKNYYGNWYVDASATSIGKSDSTGFIYNWWGCNAGGCRNHQSDSPGTATPSRQNSPYTRGRETITSIGDHNSITNTDCVGCHRSYGGTGGGANFAGQPTKTADVHTTDTCATCHAIINTHDTNEPIKSCTDCHSWTNLSQKNTISSGTTPMSNYSGNVAASGHNQNSTIPCIICHGPMHNITKPDESLRMTKNNIVEDSQCLTCHTNYNKHNGGVGCTLCHSQDVHDIQVFSQTAGYVNKGGTYQGDCTNCHQNATFLNALKNAPKAGSYSGTAPQVQKPLNHSTDRNGTKWGSYWTSTKDACIYCHGDNKHNATRLGNASVPVGSDPIGGAIGSGTVCSSCHNSTDNDYEATMALLIPDPVALKPGLNWNTSGTDHALYGATDSACKSCHGGVLSASPDISEFVHNVDVGGGPDCLKCHNSTGSANHRVDGNAISTGMHANLNPTNPADPNSKCWGCHQSDGKPPKGMGDIYNAPYKCVDCHLSNGIKSGAYGAFTINEHYPSGNDIKVLQGNNLSACIQCHNKSEMKVNYVSPDNLFTNYSLVSHYGKNRNDMHNSNETYCAYCHQNSSEFNDIFLNINNTAITHNNGQGCLTCHRESGATAGRIHDSPLLGGGGPDCRSCHDVGKNNVIRHIDFNAAGQAIHSQMNNNTDPVNGPCWGCHQTGGTSPSGMGDRAYNPYICTDCHLASGAVSGIYNAPIVSEHYLNGSDIRAAAGEITDVLSCVKCHQKNEMVLANADNDYGTYDSDNNGIFGGPTNPYIYGKKRTDMYSLNETNCSYCHQNTSEFNNIFYKLSNTQITHNNGKSCYICHREQGQINGRIHDSPLLGGGGGACLQCHSTGGGAPVVDSMDLGSHINLNTTVGGTGNLTNEDCGACHYNNPHPGTNVSNTYYCYDCHNKSAGGRAPAQYRSNNASRNFNDKKHAEATCIDCHVADGRYHQGNPRGLIANATYASRDSTNRSTYTECGDCHSMSNLDDSPFYAPGAGFHANGSCANGGGCHLGGNSVVLATHNTNPLDSAAKKPTISTPILDHSTIPRGIDVNINVTVNLTLSPAYANALVDGAQYRINNSDNTVIIQPWTPMLASDGNFNSIRENATGRINTSTLSGTYNIEVRGMAGGPAQNTSERYYPMNGDISTSKTVVLTVQPQGGFINGKITSGGNDLEGALVSTRGASDISGPDGTYSLSVPPGTYDVTASKVPMYDGNTTFNVIVSADTTSYANMSLSLKPTGTISGTVVTG